ncbi:huntingtin isoform X2 [Centruroides vittatus]|uniref:huntingtin isoform X2 n=1 Tax=Centruroides vittatus TaxID=120091 RepID=UPI00350FA4BB
MATMERLIKAFDALKVIQSPSSSDDSSKRKDIPPTKKEKIAHCNTIVDTICSPNLRSVSDFPKFLGVAVETFLLFCDDNDSDVRLMAGECLNKTIKTLLESHLGRLQVELYKEIKKDGPSRSLRAALSRFADLCHLIRPQKCRPYTMNLLPCLIKISQRIEEEAVQETLAVAIGKIMPVLGKFTNDLEIKLLLKAFLPNLVSESAAIRRTAASILIHICQHSRKPTTFFVWLLSSLLEYVIPVQEEKPVHIILGVLLCLRHLIPHLSDQERQIVLKGSIGVRQKEENIGISVDQLLQVYELLLFYTHHNDHNVITATLEALHQLLHSPPKQLIPLLLDPVGISKSQIYTIDPDLKSRCASQGGMIPESTVEDEAALEDETELTNLQIEKGTCNLEDQVFADNPSQNYINEESCLSPEDEAEDGSEYSNVIVESYSEGSSPGTLHKQSISVKSTFKLRKGLSDEKLLDEDFEKNGQWDPQDTSISSSPGTKEDFKVENIGNFTDNEVPLKYCSRLLCSTFLLTGSPDGLIPDQKVRVSIKALALSCMSSILALYPESFFLPLHTFEDIPSMNCQKIWEILKYSSHSDPHLKGHTALLLGIFIKFSLKKVGGSWDKWISEFSDLTAIPSLEELIEKLLDVIEDESAVASKLGLTAVKHCLPIILESVYGYLGLKILDSLLLLKNNPYWLVKVEMVNIISVIPFKVVHFLESRKENNNNDGLTRRIDYQDRFLRYIFLPLLEDEDFRIRQAVAHAFVKMIPNMFFEIDHDYQDPIIALTKEKTMKYLNSVFQTAFNPGILPLVHALVMPFDQEKSVSYSVSTESALSRIINLLCCTLLTSVDKYLTFGCCQTLYYLTEEYIITTYIEAWNITFGEDACIANHFSQVSKQQTPNSPAEKLKCHLESNILSHILSLVTDTHLALDLVAHKYILRLLGNLMSGACYQSLLQKGNSSKNSDEMYNEKWTLLKDRHLIPTFEQLFSHLLRLLNIFSHIIDEQSPTSNIKSGLPSLPSAPSLSPIKRKGKTKDDMQLTSTSKGSPNKVLPDKSDTEKEKSSSKVLSNIGLFFSHPLYMKIYDMLKGAYSSYKISLDLQSGEKFTGLLQACLDTLSQLLEVANSKEMGKYAEEILSYLKSVLSIEACATVQCIRQLLKSLFGTNLASLWEEPQQLSSSSKKPGYATRLTSTIAPGLYHNCVTYPYTQFTHSIANSSTRPTSAEGEEIGSWLSWMRRRSEKKLNILLRSGNKGDKASLAAHIRLFETVVIKALKQYTVTSNINLQCQVLDLLAQLVQLRVNYCLLDSDQIFIGFVIKQFEYVEEGQIPCAELLIPKIFYFLVLLSYERYHSKVIIGVPKIIQLCDGLMASGQPPDKYAIPALQPIVEDLFLLRGSNKLDSGKELDTQKEVVVSMLLRLVHYPQVLDLFLAILHQSYKEGEDRWKKLSRQIVDIILPLLSKQQLHLDEQLHLDTLHHLFEAVAPSVFRPTDILLKALFTTPQKLTDAPNLNRWMCLILVVLRVLISQGKEEVVLSRLGDLGFVIAVPKYGTDLPVQFNHPLCAEDIMINFSPSENPSSPEETFARFLFQVAGILVKAIHEQTYTITSETNDLNFLCQQMAELLLYFMHMFQSGMFRHVANSAMTLIKQETKGIEDKNVHLYSIKEISQLFLDLAPVHPTVVLQWCNVLTLLNCDNQNFWTQILRPVFNKTVNSANTLHPNTTNDTLTMTSCNLEMVRKGGIILLCDYVCENLNDAEQMTWLIVNYVNDLIQLSTETPVQDFISAIHRNPAASGLFIQAIHARCENLTKPNFVKKTLRCLEAIHPSQSGSLLNLLINKFLPTYHLATARYCDSLACCRLELLLAETTETISSQLSVEDIEKLLSIIQSSQIYNRHRRLVSLLERIKILLKPESVPVETPLGIQTTKLKDVVVNKEWYLNWVREQCFSVSPSLQECAQLLSKLSYEDALSVMTAKEFHIPVLEYCLELAIQITVSSHTKGSPVINSRTVIAESTECPMYIAAKTTLLQHITHLTGLLPQPHQAFLFHYNGNKQKLTKHHSQLIGIFSDNAFLDILFQLIPVVTYYLETLSQLPEHQEVPVDSLEDIARFSILSTEAIRWMLESNQRISPEYQYLSMKIMEAALKDTNVSFVIGLSSHITWISSAVSSVYHLVKHLQRKEDLPSVPFQKFSQSDNNDDIVAQQACIQMSELVKWLEDNDGNIKGVSEFIAEPLKSVIIGLARLPLVNSFTRTPPILWQLGWTPELDGDYKTIVPPPPGEYLQERDVLKQYIYRVNLLGWTSRQQFEETWMALLGVLSATPLSTIEAREEDMERVRTSCLAVKSITSLLLRTLLLPQPGNPQNSTFLMQPRDKPLAFLHTRCGKKLTAVRNSIHKKLQEMLKLRNGEPNLSANIERIASPSSYFFSQVSVEYLCVAIGIIDDWEEPESSVSSSSSHFSGFVNGALTYHQREQCLSAVGLDIHSCLHFLLDLYSQWLSPEACPCTPLTLLTEVTRSVVILSDIFMERAQYEWMLDTLLEVQRVHPAEDEIITQYLIFGICKAAAVLSMEQDMLEKLKKLIELSLKSTFLPTRLATLYGLLHLLEQGSGEENSPLLSTASEYILKHLGNTSLPSSQNEDHILVMWAVAVYIIENYQEDVGDNEFGQKVFQIGINICNSSEDVTSNSLYLAVLLGLERLLLTEAVGIKEIEIIMKLSVDRLKYGSPLRALAGLGLLLSCMYVGKGTDLWPSELPPSVNNSATLDDCGNVATQTDPEQLIAAMERVTTLFDRIKRGFPFEVEAICNVLPLFLMEFFPAQDVMNKVIGEFLSSQQPHPQLLASVVFQVFQHLHQQSQEDIIYDWVMLSLSNFTQRSPIAMAVWSLTCFFVSASTLPWLQALFPHLQNRMGKMEKQDRKLFCIAGIQFKNQLKDDEHRKSFYSTIKVVAHPDSPYADLLSHL